MRKFQGFPAGKIRQVSIPVQFFTELLPSIDHIGELKITLYAFWRLSRGEGNIRFIARSEFEDDELLMKSLADMPSASLTVLEESIQLCVERGTLLEVAVGEGEQAEVLFFLNTPRGRRAVDAISNGDWNPAEEMAEHFELKQEPVSIFRLYEEQIGPLNPIIADVLEEAEATYPQSWIQESFHIAAENNVRKWRYIEVILQRWSEEGKDERRNQGDSEEDRQRYIRGEFSEYIEH